MVFASMVRLAAGFRVASVRLGLCLGAVGLLGIVGGAACAIEIGGGELQVTPKLSMGAVSWDELRSKGGHKSLAGIGVAADYRVSTVGLNLDLWKWWVAEGLDSNKGIIPKDGHRIKLEVRRPFAATEATEWYPYVGIAYEDWNRHSLPGKWTSLDAFSGVAGIGFERRSAYGKAGINLPFSARTDVGEDPTPRVGFDMELGVRLAPVTIGLFWRGSSFQEPDAKLIHMGAFCGYTF